MGLVTSIDVLEKEMFPHIPVDVRFDYEKKAYNITARYF
jgi:hypothetical protein